MNQFNALHVDEQNDPPREWNRQTPSVHFKYLTPTSKTSPVVSYIMWRINHNTFDNGDVEF